MPTIYAAWIGAAAVVVAALVTLVAHRKSIGDYLRQEPIAHYRFLLRNSIAEEAQLSRNPAVARFRGQ